MTPEVSFSFFIELLGVFTNVLVSFVSLGLVSISVSLVSLGEKPHKRKKIQRQFMNYIVQPLTKLIFFHKGNK